MAYDPCEPGPACAACAHERAAHLHCRPGTDCGLCGCDRFSRSVRGVVVELLRRPRATAHRA